MISMQITPFLSYLWLTVIVCLTTCNYDLSNGHLNSFDKNFFKIKRKNSKSTFQTAFNPFRSVIDNNNLTRQSDYYDLISNPVSYSNYNNFNNLNNLNNLNDNFNKINSQLSQTSSNSFTTSSSSFLINNYNNKESPSSNEITNLEAGYARLTHNLLNQNGLSDEFKKASRLALEEYERRIQEEKLKCKTREYYYQAMNK